MRNKRFIKHTSKAFAILMSAMMAVGIAMPVSAAEKKETKVDKSETVYVNANADGSVDKITVSDWLKKDVYKRQLTNFSQKEEYYRSDCPGRAQKVLSVFGQREAMELFQSLGIYTKDKNGYVYPYSCLLYTSRCV